MPQISPPTETAQRRSSNRLPWGPPITFKDPVNGPARAIRALVQEQMRLEALGEHARQAARDLSNEGKARAAGHTHTVCTRCGNTRTLSWARGHCSEFDGSTDDQMCGGTYRAAGSC